MLFSFAILATACLRLASSSADRHKLTTNTPTTPFVETHPKFNPLHKHATDIYIDNNHQWAKSHDPALMEKVQSGQKPNILVFSCADSRVNVERMLKAGMGEIFMFRDVGGIFYADDINALSTLEYAINFLDVRHVIAMGHYECGAVHTALHGGHALDSLDEFLSQIFAVKDHFQRKLHKLSPVQQWRKLVELSADATARVLNDSRYVKDARRKGKKIYVHAWVYALHTFRVSELAIYGHDKILPPYLKTFYQGRGLVV